MIDINTALDNVGITYDNLVAISDEIVAKYTAPVEGAIGFLTEHIHELNNEVIRQAMLDIALKSYSLGEAKEHASLKSECAETLSKEAQAKVFNEATGTVDVKKNTAMLESSSEILADMVYEQVASQLTRKLDECHRIVDVMKNILISRASEAKLVSVSDGIEEVA